MSAKPWDMSWWEYARRHGLPDRVSAPVQRIERGPGSYVASSGVSPEAPDRVATRKPPPRDYLSEPTDWLALPLEYLQRRS